MATLAGVTTPPPPTIQPAAGRLGVLTVGLGAVSSTLIAGVELAKRGQAAPIGSLTQMATIRLGKRTDNRTPLIRDFVPLASLDDIVFGAWDPFPDDAYVAAQRAGVLESGKHLEGISDALRDVRPMKAAFDREYVKRLDGENTIGTIDKRSMLEAIREDINRFRDEKQVDRVVMLWAASTEIFIEPGPGTPDDRVVRGGDRRQRPDDRPVDAVRLRGDPRRRAVRQRRAQPHGRHPRPARARRRARRADLRQGLQDRSDADQDRARPDAQGAHARAVGLVLDQHPRQPRRRGARRSRQLQDQGGVEARRARAHPRARQVPRASTATCTTRSASTTTRRAATTRRAGTTSTSSAGSATRCSSRSTSCAATRSSPRRWRSTSCCSPTSPSGPGWAASRSG